MYLYLVKSDIVYTVYVCVFWKFGHDTLEHMTLIGASRICTCAPLREKFFSLRSNVHL